MNITAISMTYEEGKKNITHKIRNIAPSEKKGVDKRSKTSYHGVVRAEPLENPAVFAFSGLSQRHSTIPSELSGEAWPVHPNMSVRSRRGN